METYRASFHATPNQGWTQDDVLAIAIQAVDSVTIVDKAEWDHPMPGIWLFILDYQGLNPTEAAKTAQTMLKAVQSAGLAADSLRVMKGRERVA